MKEEIRKKIEEIERLKKEKNAAVMAHYYVCGEVQEAADFVGDSYYLSERSSAVDAETIVMCGVSFMGESAKILNPQKKILLPEPEADCPMAHMADLESLRAVKNEHPDAAVVCYVNSSAELKACSDVCVTSSNALRIVRALPQRDIYFIPDKNLGRYLASQCPEKRFFFNDGFCPVHAEIAPESVAALKAAHPEALVLAHPECAPQTAELADYIGSTAGIISFAGGSSCSEFIVCTETGVLYELQRQNPQKRFYVPERSPVCGGMKRITLENVADALRKGETEVCLEEELLKAAARPMKRMMSLSEIKTV